MSISPMRPSAAATGSSFRTLEELGAYMERLMHDSDQPEVAKALYGPFYESFRKGIGNVGL